MNEIFVILSYVEKKMLKYFEDHLKHIHKMVLWMIDFKHDPQISVSICMFKIDEILKPFICETLNQM